MNLPAASVPLVVQKATPVIAMAIPVSIILLGASSGRRQLNATRHVAVRSLYTPAAGGHPSGRTKQFLAFAPADQRQLHNGMRPVLDCDTPAALTVQADNAQSIKWPGHSRFNSHRNRFRRRRQHGVAVPVFSHSQHRADEGSAPGSIPCCGGVSSPTMHWLLHPESWTIAKASTGTVLTSLRILTEQADGTDQRNRLGAGARRECIGNSFNSWITAL